MSKRTYTQEEAAVKLGVSSVTLRRRRKENTVREDLVVSAGSLTGLGKSVVLFDADLVDEIAAGRQRFDRVEAVAL